MNSRKKMLYFTRVAREFNNDLNVKIMNKKKKKRTVTSTYGKTYTKKRFVHVYRIFIMRCTHVYPLPCQSFLGAGHSARVVFEHEPSGAQNVRLDVATPLQLRHVKVKRLLVVGIELGEQFLHVRVLKVPFVRSKKL